MISNGLNKVVLCDLVIVEILPVLEKNRSIKSPGPAGDRVFRPPPPPPDVASGENFFL